MTTPSQLLLSAIIGFIIVRTWIAYKKRNLSPAFSLTWVLFWIAGLVLIFNQDITTSVAKRLSISRGVDLVIYVSLICVFYMIYRMLARMENQERKITKMVRKIAINDSRKKSGK